MSFFNHLNKRNKTIKDMLLLKNSQHTTLLIICLYQHTSMCFIPYLSLL